MLHQKTAAALYSLLLEAYEEQDPDQELSLEDWAENNMSQSPTFYFWLLVLNLECLLLNFVKSMRQKNYEYFVRCLITMLPWFFVFDHTNYARWLSVHLKDLIDLKFTAPSIDALFKAGTFYYKHFCIWVQ